MSSNPSHSPYLLDVQGVSKSFRGVHAVDNISFSVTAGEIVAIIGPNGAGKTSLFNLISGYLHSDQGHIRFGDKEITKLRPDKICLQGMGRTFQLVKPFRGLTVLDNVVIGALAKENNINLAKEQSMEILKLFNLDNKKNQVAEYLTLSERKRLEVARALATKPKLLLLDEVMAGLRPNEIDQFMHIFKSLNQGMKLTILMIEHVMRAVMALSHHIIVLNYGQKIAEGAPEEISKNPDVLKCYLGEDYALINEMENQAC